MKPRESGAKRRSVTECKLVNTLSNIPTVLSSYYATLERLDSNRKHGTHSSIIKDSALSYTRYIEAVYQSLQAWEGDD
ncbi:hypothetical protein RRG08_054183 [Elysia crispata]|uniref:Uncharacterized protein n=1 Tax=Elysia crispata TaxID=231223 RepID=A0AAE1A2F7_9GAST|nr:hypothetical protein RRG08_054183 [Elysia crispata]